MPNPEYDAEELIGVTFAGRYDVVEKIGRGGMGIIYRARQRGLNRDVVLKILPDNDGGSNAMARFTREAQQLSRLRHPNTVTIFDYGAEKGLAYIAMEYVEGKTLKTLIAEHGRLESELFIAIATQILDALAEAHQMGIVHRDVKPANIMLCDLRGEQNVVKILDFGLAKLVTGGVEVTKKQELVGSAYFLSPEQILLEEIDTRADVYALGVLFYAMLAGRLPFRGPDEMTTLYQHLHEEPKHLSRRLPEDHNVPTDLIALVHRMLAKDREDRPKDAGEVLKEFQRIEERPLLPPHEIPFRESQPDLFAHVPVAEPISQAAPSQAQEEREISLIIDTTKWGDGDKMPGVPAQFPAPGPHQLTAGSGIHSMPGLDTRAWQMVPPAADRTRGIYFVITAVILVVGIVGAVYLSQQNTEVEDKVATQQNLVKLLDRADLLTEERKYAQCEILLRSVQDHLIEYPELLVRAAAIEDRTVIARLMEEGKAHETKGERELAIKTYKGVLERDSTHPEATRHLRELVEQDRWSSDAKKEEKTKAAAEAKKKKEEEAKAAAEENSETPEIVIVKIKPARLKVNSWPSGTVYIDDLPVGESPVVVKLKPGKHQVEIRSPGYRSWLKPLWLRERQRRTLDARLRVDPNASKITLARRREKAKERKDKARQARKERRAKARQARKDKDRKARKDKARKDKDRAKPAVESRKMVPTPDGKGDAEGAPKAIASPRLSGKRKVSSAGALKGILGAVEREVIERNGFAPVKVRGCTSLLFREINRTISDKGSAMVSPSKIYYSVARWVRSGKATSAIAQGLVARYRAGRFQ